MNETINFTYDLNGYTGIVKDLKFEQIIRDTCENWKGYSTFAHIFYFKLIIVFYILGIISKFWNPRFYHIPKTKYKWFNDFFEFDLKIVTFIRKFLVSLLMIRIVQIYLISKLHLGGL